MGKMLFHYIFTLKEANELLWQKQISTFVSSVTMCYYVYGKKEIHTIDLFPLLLCA